MPVIIFTYMMKKLRETKGGATLLVVILTVAIFVMLGIYFLLGGICLHLLIRFIYLLQRIRKHMMPEMRRGNDRRDTLSGHPVKHCFARLFILCSVVYVV